MAKVKKTPKRIGSCKHCFCALGYDSLGILVHTHNLAKTCNGHANGKKAELR